MLLTIGSMLQTSVELKIYYILFAVHMLYLLLLDLSGHIGHLVGAAWACSVFIFIL